MYNGQSAGGGAYTTGDVRYQDRFGVYWGLVGGVGTDNQATLGDSTEFQFWRDNYEDYRITGVKMEWKPEIVVGGGV